MVKFCFFAGKVMYICRGSRENMRGKLSSHSRDTPVSRLWNTCLTAVIHLFHGCETTTFLVQRHETGRGNARHFPTICCTFVRKNCRQDGYLEQKEITPITRLNGFKIRKTYSVTEFKDAKENLIVLVGKTTATSVKFYKGSTNPRIVKMLMRELGLLERKTKKKQLSV